MEHRTFEFEVPTGYREVYHINASDKKTGLKMTLGATAILVVLVVLVVLWADFSKFNFRRIMTYDIVWIAVMLVYIVLHELVHGAVYKALTHQKLRFGITWNAAFCGVPDIYTYRSTALASLVAPLTVFTIIFLPLAVWLHSVDMGWYRVAGLTFALHLSGCVGDMFMTRMFLKKFKDPRTLMRDTGPEQWIYMPEADAVSEPQNLAELPAQEQ